MAPLFSPHELFNLKKSEMRLNLSSSKPPLKTYSKRVLQDSHKPPSKRQCIESCGSNDNTIVASAQPLTPSPRKRSISDYFRTRTHTNTPPSPQSSILSSHPIQKDINSPPSSPPSLHSPSASVQRPRTRRRLIARPPLEILKMSELNANGSREQGNKKRKASPPFLPGSPPRTSYLTKTSPPGLRQAAKGGTSSDEDEATHLGTVDAPDSRIPNQELITVPFAPARRYSIFSRLGFGTSGDDEQLASDALTDLQTIFTRSNIEGLSNADPLAADKLADQDSSSDQIGGSATGVRGAARQISHQTSSADAATQTEKNPAVISQNTKNPSPVQGALGSISGMGPQPSVHLTGTQAVGAQATITNADAFGNLVQTQLSLGVSTNITCKICHLTFNQTILGDVRTHSEFHATHTSGVRVNGLTFTPQILVSTFSATGDFIVKVSRNSAQSWKDLAMTVLETHVDRDLGTTAFSSDRLWSTIPDPEGMALSITGEVDRYQVYMYAKRHQGSRHSRVVSLLLAERIAQGFETTDVQLTEDEFGPWPAIVVNERPSIIYKYHNAVLGINKIWTLARSRRSGYARALLDAARDKNFIPYYEIPRIKLAWTQTSDLGDLFARNYMRGQTDYDYLGYDEEK